MAKPRPRPWTRLDDWAISDAARLTRHYGLKAPFAGYQKRLRQVAEELGRTYAAVRKRASRKKIRSYRRPKKM